MCGVEARIVDDDGNPLPHDGKAVGEMRGAWPVDHWLVLPQPR